MRAWGEALEAALDRRWPERPSPGAAAGPSRGRRGARRDPSEVEAALAAILADGGASMSAQGLQFARKTGRSRRGRTGLAVMVLAGGALARRGLARPRQCELVGRGLGLCRLPAVRREPEARRPGAVRAARGRRFPGSLPEDGARRAGHGGRGRRRRNRVPGRRAGRPGQDRMRSTGGRSRRSRPGSSRRGSSTCTAITSTARQPLRRDRAGAPRTHPGPRRRHAGHPVARPGRAGGHRSAGRFPEDRGRDEGRGAGPAMVDAVRLLLLRGRAVALAPC